MNNLFEGGRFALLWRAHWAESWREYAWFMALAAMVDVVFIALFLGIEGRNSAGVFHFDEQLAWYTTGLFVLAGIFAGRYFKNFTNSGAALITIMRPASLLEKWILTFIIVGVVFPLVYTMCYALLNYPAMLLAKTLYLASANCGTCDAEFRLYIPFLTENSSRGAMNNGFNFLRIQEFLLLVLWSVQALILGGTLFFKRSPVLKTILVLFLLSVVILWLGYSPKAGPFWSPVVDDDIPYRSAESALSFLLWTSLPLLLWVAVFFHLKDREVS